MRPPRMRRIAPEVLATAKAQRWDPAEILRTLLAEEVAGRDKSSLATRRARAAFPTGKTFEAWDERLSSVPAPTQAALRTLEWVGRHQNLVVCGPSGTGKTFMLEALGQAIVESGRNVAWFTLEEVGALVRRHRADDSVTRAIARILRADLVVVDLCRHRNYAEGAPDIAGPRSWGRSLIGIVRCHVVLVSGRRSIPACWSQAVEEREGLVGGAVAARFGWR
ncbi:MAG: ATP-binding protein [Actinomycetota bacterium]|nr:ATP-binding protein [Actinomycetota bacterium]